MAVIIIQENDCAVLDVLKQAFMLEDHHPIPILGSCTEELSKLIRRHRPDLVLIDYRSTSPCGALLLAAIRKISSALPVIALSCDLNIGKMASKLGFDGFLSKPFDLGELYAKVDSFLNGEPNLKVNLAE